MTKKRRKYVKRPRVNWYEKLMATSNVDAKNDFYILMARYPRWSFNRLASCVVRHHYSTTTLERVRWLGESL